MPLLVELQISFISVLNHRNKTFESDKSNVLQFIHTFFLLHVCEMTLLYLTQYFRPTLKEFFKSLIV